MTEKISFQSQVRYWAPYPFLIFTVTAPTFLVLAKNNAGAGILAAVGVACLLMLRLEDISEFAGFGVKAKLERTIREAEVTLERLRSLSLALSKPIIADIAMHGQVISRLSTEFRVELHAAVVEALKALNATDKQIAEVDEIWREVGARKLLSLIQGRLTELSQSGAAAEISAIEQKMRSGGIETHIIEVEAVVEKLQLGDGELSEWIEDLREMLKSGTVRRPDKIPFNLSIGR